MEPGSEPVQEEWLEDWMVENLKKWQSADPHMSRVISWLNEGQGKPRWKEISRYGRDTKAHVLQWESLHQKDGILCRVWYYNMTVWILAGNYSSFTIAAGLIRLHMPGVKKSRV